jgi:hypothetical protein
MVLSFALTVLLGGLLELIRGLTPGGIARSGVTVTIALFASAFATAIVAPILFALVRWVDPVSERAPT